MQEKVNSRKENEIRVFGFAMKNSPENDFWYLVTFRNAIFLQIFHVFSTLKQIL